MVQVKVNEGLLEGEVIQNEFDGQFFSFKGIPYAEPPVGKLRFKAPQPKKPWVGLRSAKEFGSVCIQLDPFISKEPYGSEDCLYLNVYSPNINPNSRLPVMFWIHGGAFKFGSGNDDYYGPEFLIRHGVILVTINYRLEALGLLSLDTEEIPGNAGMKDQVAALRWVKANILSFGGDPENITIFGESAGGASTSFHLVSPMTKGLFKRAIVQSGALTCYWALAFEPRERALKLAKQLGFYSEDEKELADFFTKVPAKDLIGLSLPVAQSHKSYEVTFTVCSEKKFGENERYFYGDPTDAVRNGIHSGVEVIIGYNKDEGLMALAFDAIIDDFISSANNYKDYLAPSPIQLNCNIKHQIEAGRKIKAFYFKDKTVSKQNFERLLTFLNWDMFLYGIVLSTKLMSMKNRVYLYKFTCISERNVTANLFNLKEIFEMTGKRSIVCHADDLFYLFPYKIARLKVDKDSETFNYINKVTTLWTNFAKYGNPTPDSSLGAQWLPYTVDKKDYLDIGNQLTAGNAPDQEDDQFWDALLKEYLPNYTV